MVMWVLGIEPGSSGRAATALHTESSLQAPRVALNKLFMCIIYMQCLQRPQGVIQFPGTEVINCGLAKCVLGIKTESSARTANTFNH